MSNQLMPSPLAIALEMSEARYWGKLYRRNALLSSYHTQVAGAFVGATPELDVLAMNRVIGLGMTSPVTNLDIENIIAFYKQLGVRRFFVQLSPEERARDLPNRLEKNGFRLYNRWAKLLRPADLPLTPRAANGLRLVEVDSTKADVFGQIILFSFDWEDTRVADWFAGAVGQPGYRHYLVYKNHVAIAAGALHIDGAYSSLAIAGTLPDYRGLGAQSLLIQARLAAARAAGSHYTFVETAEDRLDRPVPSYRNMIKAGFELAYLRDNWIFEFE